MEQEEGGYRRVETSRTIAVTVIRHSTDLVDQVYLGEDTLLNSFFAICHHNSTAPLFSMWFLSGPIAACRSSEWAKKNGRPTIDNRFVIVYEGLSVFGCVRCDSG